MKKSGKAKYAGSSPLARGLLSEAYDNHLMDSGSSPLARGLLIERMDNKDA